jgi:hypothetical protein
VATARAGKYALRFEAGKIGTARTTHTGAPAGAVVRIATIVRPAKSAREAIRPGPDQRLLNCVPRRAPRRPYFFRSFMRPSRVSIPLCRNGSSSSVSKAFRARAIPRRQAPAWPVGPPPSTVMSTLTAV